MPDRTFAESMSDENDIIHRQKRPRSKGRLWPWFLMGFLLVFIGLALTLTMSAMHPSGAFVVASPLWMYYLLEIQRAWTATDAIGPDSGSTSAAIVVALQHILISLAGGAVFLGIGWGWHKVRDRKRTAGGK